MAKESVIVESSVSGLDVTKAREFARNFLSGGQNPKGGAPEAGDGGENDQPQGGTQTIIQHHDLDDSLFTRDVVQHHAKADDFKSFGKDLEEDDSDENGLLDEEKAKKKAYPKGIDKRVNKLVSTISAITGKYNELVPKFNELVDYAQNAEKRIASEQDLKVKAEDELVHVASRSFALEASLIDTAKKLVALQISEARREYAEAAAMDEHAKVADAIAKLNKAAQDQARIEVAEPDYQARLAQAQARLEQLRKDRAAQVAAAPKADKVNGDAPKMTPENERLRNAFIEKHKDWFDKDAAMMKSLGLICGDLLNAKKIDPNHAPDEYYRLVEESMAALYPAKLKAKTPEKKQTGGSPVLTPGSSSAAPEGGSRELSDFQKSLIKASGKTGKEAEAFIAAIIGRK
jgi:hypothetical protein